MNDNHIAVINELHEAMYTAAVVGGYVRDTLLNRESKDVDIVTSALPSEVAEIMSSLDCVEGVDFVGAAFGVTLVRFKDGTTCEVATFRTEGAYGDNRHPDDVTFTMDVREDLKRRDFTINALLMGPDGKVDDFVGGLSDLNAGLIRAIGDPNERFKEDALRMLRAVRFACQLDFTIEHETRHAIYRNADLLKNISAERVQMEFSKILTSGNAAIGVDLLAQLNLLSIFLPEWEEMFACEQDPAHHPEGNVYYHTLLALERLPKPCSLTLALGALLHDVGKPSTTARHINVVTGETRITAHGHDEAGVPIAEAILRRLKYPNEVIDKVKYLVGEHMKFRVLGDMRRSKRLRFVRHEHFNELLELHRVDALAGSGNLNNYEDAVELLKHTPPEVLRPTPLINGHDLINMGLKPGPLFKIALNVVEDMQLNGLISSREEALDAANKFTLEFQEPTVE